MKDYSTFECEPAAGWVEVDGCSSSSSSTSSTSSDELKLNLPVVLVRGVVGGVPVELYKFNWPF